MAKDVLITIKSAQTVDDVPDTTELFTCGTMEKTENGHRIVYEESETTGFEGSTVTLEVSDNVVTMNRTGKAMSSLIIEKGKKHHCHYGTEYGSFLIGIATDEIRNSITDDGGKLYLKYTLDINSSFMSVNEMFLNIKECETNEQHD